MTRIDTARNDRRQKLLRFLESGEPVWKDDEHPELKRGTGAWVRGLRQEEDRLRSRRRRKQR